MKLNVSECFYSIQGEGVTTGVPSVFLRLGGCNLLCQGSGWICDTIEVWSKSKATEFEDVINVDWVQRLKDGAHLIITGGEPMLHQGAIAMYLDWFYFEHGFIPYVEIETNGTIVPDKIFTRFVNQFNCSPKLSNSGAAQEQRFNSIALRALASLKTYFKFVICNEGDVLEVLNEFGWLPMQNFIFMPGGDTRELLNLVRPLVVEQCIKLGIRYTDRQHIVIWNKKTGV